MDRDVKAWLLIVVVIESLSNGLNWVKLSILLIPVRVPGSFTSGAGSGNGPSWKRLNEASRVWIVDHGHSSDRVAQRVDETLDPIDYYVVKALITLVGMLVAQPVLP